MTEAEWNDCDDAAQMLEWLRHSGKASERKLRLFGCACCRGTWHLLGDERSRTAVEVAERFADGLAGEPERQVTEMAADKAVRTAVVLRQQTDYTIPEMFTLGAKAARIAVSGQDGDGTEPAVAVVAACSLIARNENSGLRSWQVEHSAHCGLLRDLFNAFHPVAFDPAWRTPTVLSLAQRAYEERLLPSGHLDTSLLAALADALGRAGCDNEKVLGHLCEQGGVHVRGCFVVDLVLGWT